MTRAPASLLAVRSLLLTHLDDAPGPNDLEPVDDIEATGRVVIAGNACCGGNGFEASCEVCRD